MRKYPIERLFKALADPTRLRLINLIAEQEVCVCYFVEVIDAPQPKISRHLAYLRRAGIVSARREGKWIHYSLMMPSDPHAAAILQATVDSLKRKKDLLRDFQRLTRACCGPKSLAHVIGAPMPTLDANEHRKSSALPERVCNPRFKNRSQPPTDPARSMLEIDPQLGKVDEVT
jgi:ArsR family transcriptional regulator, arsenate/arsenite/antimonite-responsive transcriptional repressor